ncbi:ABC transporter permease [Bacteroides gallinarum]|uniref:ABC transporter permease n=1 Tax=Bacteroides gallinarum TaxID=376806 RepID=UPI00037A0D36|nr:FtsX-like permease family protein [Bacteroides gallinarum]
MLKLILKNLWARRRRNGWLLAELILVSIVSWAILDPVIVVTHDRSIPLGYDADRLCLVSLGALPAGVPGYNVQAQDSAVMVDNYMHFVRLVRDYPGVEQAAPLLGYCYPNSQGSSNYSFQAEGDTVDGSAMCIEFMPHTHFFETYGFRPGQGMTPEQLSDYDYTQNDIVMTENALRKFFHSQEPFGKRGIAVERGDTTYISVIGTVGTLKIYSEWRPVAVMFRPQLSVDVSEIPERAQILIRLKEGVGMERFMHEFRPWMIKTLQAGNLFARSIQPYEKLIATREYAGVTSVYRRNLAIAGFFLVNLCLGVIGTFWLQTRTRREEVGVMLSFGATPGHIVRLLMGEGVVLTSVAVCTGCLLYLQYALKEGVNEGSAWVQSTETYWVTDFAPHFLIVSCAVFLIMLAVVLAGIYIPARRISRIPPTEALRDE